MMESPEMYVRRAVDMASSAHDGQFRKYTNEPYITHPMNVAMLVGRVIEDPQVIAAAWLHDVIEDCGDKVTLADIANQFGFIVASYVKALSDLTPHSEGNRAYRKQKYADQLVASSSEVQSIKLADLIDNTPSILENDWNFAKVYVKEVDYLLSVLTKADDRLRAIAHRVIANAKVFLTDVVGDAPKDVPKLSNGYPSTLGAYRVLSISVFGPGAPSVTYLTDRISKAPLGVGEPVLADEGQMLLMLEELNEKGFDVVH